MAAVLAGRGKSLAPAQPMPDIDDDRAESEGVPFMGEAPKIGPQQSGQVRNLFKFKMIDRVGPALHTGEVQGSIPCASTIILNEIECSSIRRCGLISGTSIGDRFFQANAVLNKTHWLDRLYLRVTGRRIFRSHRRSAQIAIRKRS
jgi:hypothetical protein